MKNYLKGIIILTIIIIIIFFLVSKLHRYLNDTRDRFLQLKEINEGNKKNYALMEEDLLAKRRLTQTIDGFLANWEPFLNKGIDSDKVLNDMVEISFLNTVAISEKSVQRLKVNENNTFKDILIISLKVIGKFERVYAWLGAVEEAYPHAKMSELELIAENKNAVLIVRFQLPVVI